MSLFAVLPTSTFRTFVREFSPSSEVVHRFLRRSESAVKPFHAGGNNRDR